MYGSGLSLLSVVAGYWVLERASTHKGSLKRAGQLVGWFVIVASILSVVCRAWCVSGMKSGYCPFSKTGKSWQMPSGTPMTPSGDDAGSR